MYENVTFPDCDKKKLSPSQIAIRKALNPQFKTYQK